MKCEAHDRLESWPFTKRCTQEAKYRISMVISDDDDSEMNLCASHAYKYISYEEDRENNVRFT